MIHPAPQNGTWLHVRFDMLWPSLTISGGTRMHDVCECVCACHTCWAFTSVATADRTPVPTAFVGLKIAPWLHPLPILSDSKQHDLTAHFKLMLRYPGFRLHVNYTRWFPLHRLAGLKALSHSLQSPSVAFPARIGCGLAGGKWPEQLRADGEADSADASKDNLKTIEDMFIYNIYFMCILRNRFGYFVWHGLTVF